MTYQDALFLKKNIESDGLKKDGWTFTNIIIAPQNAADRRRFMDKYFKDPSEIEPGTAPESSDQEYDVFGLVRLDDENFGYKKIS